MTPNNQPQQSPPMIAQGLVQKFFDLLPGLVIVVITSAGGSFFAIQNAQGNLEKDLRASQIVIKENREELLKVSQRNQEMAIRLAEINGDLKNVLETVRDFKEAQRNQYNSQKR